MVARVHAGALCRRVGQFPQVGGGLLQFIRKLKPEARVVGLREHRKRRIVRSGRTEHREELAQPYDACVEVRALGVELVEEDFLSRLRVRCGPQGETESERRLRARVVRAALLVIEGRVVLVGELRREVGEGLRGRSVAGRVGQFGGMLHLMREAIRSNQKQSDGRVGQLGGMLHHHHIREGGGERLAGLSPLSTAHLLRRRAPVSIRGVHLVQAGGGLHGHVC